MTYDIRGSTVILQSYQIIPFVHKENNNNIIYSAIHLPELPSSTILESTPERNQHCLCSG